MQEDNKSFTLANARDPQILEAPVEIRGQLRRTMDEHRLWSWGQYPLTMSEYVDAVIAAQTAGGKTSKSD